MNQQRIAGGLLLGALASGALAVAALGTAGAANATCASFSGVNAGSGCTTANIGDTAIGLGPDTVVSASGGFNTSIAVGNEAFADSFGTGNSSLAFGTRATALTEGRGNLAFVLGNPGPNPGIVDPVLGDIEPTDEIESAAGAFGNFNRAVVFGNGSSGYAVGGTTFNDMDIPGANNTAFTFGNGSNADAFGLNRFAGAFGSTRNAINGINNTP